MTWIYGSACARTLSSGAGRIRKKACWWDPKRCQLRFLWFVAFTVLTFIGSLSPPICLSEGSILVSTVTSSVSPLEEGTLGFLLSSSFEARRVPFADCATTFSRPPRGLREVGVAAAEPGAKRLRGWAVAGVRVTEAAAALRAASVRAVGVAALAADAVNKMDALDAVERVGRVRGVVAGGAAAFLTVRVTGVAGSRCVGAIAWKARRRWLPVRK